MFRPSGTHQYNPKFPKILLKLNENESGIYNHVYRIRQFNYASRVLNQNTNRVNNVVHAYLIRRVINLVRLHQLFLFINIFHSLSEWRLRYQPDLLKCICISWRYQCITRVIMQYMFITCSRYINVVHKSLISLSWGADIHTSREIMSIV